MIFPFVQYSLIHDLAQRVHRWIQVVNCQKAIKPTILAVAPSIYINRLWVLDMYLDIRCLFGNRMSDLYSNSYQMIISDIHRRSIWLWMVRIYWWQFHMILMWCINYEEHNIMLNMSSLLPRTCSFSLLLSVHLSRQKWSQKFTYLGPDHVPTYALELTFYPFSLKMFTYLKYFFLEAALITAIKD